MNKHSEIFYDIFLPKYNEFLSINDDIKSTINDIIESKYNEDDSEFKRATNLFTDEEEIDNDFNILKFFISHRNTFVFNDHTPALRLYRQTNTTPKGLLELYKKNPSEKLEKIIKLHIDVICYDGFFLNNHSNHCLDQIISIIKYNDLFNDIKNIDTYISLFQEYVDTCYTKNGIHIENSPYYHYYSVRQLYNVLDDITQKKVLNYLYLCMAPNKELINIGDGNFIPFFEADKNTILKDIQKKVDNYNEEQGFFYFDCGHLIIKYEDIYFFMKSSLKHTWHHHYDNNSFILFYKNHNFFIDAGMHSYEYKSFGRKFVTSPQAHNLFVLNNNNLLQKIHTNLYHCDSVKINENTYKFVTEYYKNINYERTIKYDNTKKKFNFTDRVGVVPSDYKYYYILFHLNKNAQVSIKTNKIHIEIDNVRIILELMEETNLESIQNILDGDFEGMHIGYNSPDRNIIIKIPTIVFKFKNNNIENKHSFHISLL